MGEKAGFLHVYFTNSPVRRGQQHFPSQCLKQRPDPFRNIARRDQAPLEDKDVLNDEFISTVTHFEIGT